MGLISGDTTGIKPELTTILFPTLGYKIVPNPYRIRRNLGHSIVSDPHCMRTSDKDPHRNKEAKDEVYIKVENKRCEIVQLHKTPASNRKARGACCA